MVICVLFLILCETVLAAGLPRYEIGDVGTNESVPAVVIGNRIAVTGTGSKLLSVRAGKQGSTTEVAYIDKAGNLVLSGTITMSGTAATLEANLLKGTNLSVTTVGTIGSTRINGGVNTGVLHATSIESTGGGLINGNLTISSTVSATSVVGTLSGTIETYSVSVIQAQITSIETGSTVTYTFPFIPSKIFLVWSGQTQGTISTQWGFAWGQTLIVRTGVNTITSNLNGINTYGDTHTNQGIANDTTNTSYCRGGASGQSTLINSVGTWSDATKTLTLTFTRQSTAVNSTAVFCGTATAYK